MLAAHRKRHGLGLKAAVNQALRRGLEAELRPPQTPRKRFATREADHGRLLLPGIDDIGGVLEALEGTDSR
jgi:hypothetical protein